MVYPLFVRLWSCRLAGRRGFPGTATSTPSGSGQQSQIAVVRLRMKLRFINACLTHVRLTSAILGRRHFLNTFSPPLTPSNLFRVCPGWWALLHERHGALVALAAFNGCGEHFGGAVE